MALTQTEQIAALPVVVPEGQYAPGSPGVRVASIFDQVTRAVVLHDDPDFLIGHEPGVSAMKGYKFEAGPGNPFTFDTDALAAQMRLCIKLANPGGFLRFRQEDVDAYLGSMEQIGCLDVASHPQYGVSRAPRYALEVLMTPPGAERDDMGVRLGFDYWRDPRGGQRFGNILLGAYFPSSVEPVLARLLLGGVRLPEDVESRPKQGTVFEHFPRLLTAIQATIGSILKS